MLEILSGCKSTGCTFLVGGRIVDGVFKVCLHPNPSSHIETHQFIMEKLIRKIIKCSIIPPKSTSAFSMFLILIAETMLMPSYNLSSAGSWRFWHTRDFKRYVCLNTNRKILYGYLLDWNKGKPNVISSVTIVFQTSVVQKQCLWE